MEIADGRVVRFSQPLERQESERNRMKFLLTSAGLTNKSIRLALEDLLGKPIVENGDGGENRLANAFQITS